MIFGHSVALYCVPIHTEGRKPATSCSLSQSHAYLTMVLEPPWLALTLLVYPAYVKDIPP